MDIIDYIKLVENGFCYNIVIAKEPDASGEGDGVIIMRFIIAMKKFIADYSFIMVVN